MYTISFETKGENVNALVIYDVTSAKRLRKIAKCMEGYGKRVQKSSFEVSLPKKKFVTMKDTILKIIAEDDTVRIYPIINQNKVENITTKS